MLEAGVENGSDDGYVRFHEAEAEARGEFHCAECGYGVIVHTRLPACPMCAGRLWEQSSSSRRGRFGSRTL